MPPLSKPRVVVFGRVDRPDQITGDREVAETVRERIQTALTNPCRLPSQSNSTPYSNSIRTAPSSVGMRGAQNLKGYRETDIVGEHFSVFYPEAARAVNWPDRELELAVENDSFEDEGWRVRNDGSRFWAHVNITARFDDEGSLEGFTKVTRDLTERREHELYLRAFREAIEQSRHSIYFTNVDGTIEYVNPAFEVITGYTAEEAIGEDPRFLNADDTTADFYRDLQRTIHGGDVWIGEVVNRRKSGETYTVHQTTAPIKNAENSIERFVTINTDISERKGRERTLRRQRNELERHHQITESLRSLNRVLTRASTRNEAEQLVCDRLASSEAYRFAWIANNGPGNDIVPHTWAGIEDERLSDVTITTDDSDLEHSPAGRALRSGTVHAVQDILSDPTYERWHAACSSVWLSEFGGRSAGVPGHRLRCLGVVFEPSVCVRRARATPPSGGRRAYRSYDSRRRKPAAPPC